MKQLIHAQVPPKGKAESYEAQGVSTAQNITSQPFTRYAKLFFVLCFCVLFSNTHRALGVSIQINTSIEVCNDNGCEISKLADVGIIEIYQGRNGLIVRINWNGSTVLQFLNDAGYVVHRSELPSHEYVNIGTLPPGNYRVEVVTDSGKTERKTVVIH